MRRKRLTVHAHLFQGLGDSIYSRPHIKQLSRDYDDVYVTTSWPELFLDIPRLKFIKPRDLLRSPSKVKRDDSIWTYPLHAIDRLIYPRYGPNELKAGLSITQSLELSIPLEDSPQFDLPPRLARPPVINSGDRPVAIMRPVTIREEWRNESRSPLPEYINIAATELMKTHYVVVVADVDNKSEWLDGPAPTGHLNLIHGELTSFEMLELAKRADCLVGGVGFIVPLALATRTPAFIINGGCGAYNRAEVLIDSRVSAEFITFIEPDEFCLCGEHEHDCNKIISNFKERFSKWHQAIQLLTI